MAILNTDLEAMKKPVQSKKFPWFKSLDEWDDAIDEENANNVRVQQQQQPAQEEKK